jgi:hypothetical protein
MRWRAGCILDLKASEMMTSLEVRLMLARGNGTRGKWVAGRQGEGRVAEQGRTLAVDDAGPATGRGGRKGGVHNSTAVKAWRVDLGGVQWVMRGAGDVSLPKVGFLGGYADHGLVVRVQMGVVVNLQAVGCQGGGEL